METSDSECFESADEDFQSDEEEASVIVKDTTSCAQVEEAQRHRESPRSQDNIHTQQHSLQKKEIPSSTKEFFSNRSNSSLPKEENSGASKEEHHSLQKEVNPSLSNEVNQSSEDGNLDGIKELQEETNNKEKNKDKSTNKESGDCTTITKDSSNSKMQRALPDMSLRGSGDSKGIYIFNKVNFPFKILLFHNCVKT